MRFDFRYDPFGYPVYRDKWILVPGGNVELLRVEEVIDPDGRVRYYHPARPSFLCPDPREFGVDQVADTKGELEAKRGGGEGESPLEGLGWPTDL